MFDARMVLAFALTWVIALVVCSWAVRKTWELRFRSDIRKMHHSIIAVMIFLAVLLVVILSSFTRT